MEKYYFSRHKLWIYIVTIALMIILLASIIVNILRICSVGSLVSTSIALDITSSAIMFIVFIVLSAFVFFSGYAIKKEALQINVGFSFSKIKYDELLLIRMNSKKTILLLYVETKQTNADVEDKENGLKANMLQIYIPSKNMDEFISRLKQHNKNVVVEILENEEKTK